MSRLRAHAGANLAVSEAIEKRHHPLPLVKTYILFLQTTGWTTWCIILLFDFFLHATLGLQCDLQI